MSETSSKGALDGVRVIDLSRVLGGPYCTQILGDHGADVIKIEPPQGDETRLWGPPFLGDAASYFHGVNRNKRGMALDLAQPEGREIVFRLLADADVLVENFKAGTLERWGMGYEAVLKERFPRLIHCRVLGFGADGPWGGYAGYDAAVQGMSGLMSLNGEADGPPLRVGVPVVDMATGMNAACGILMAIIERQRSGRGQLIDMALYDSAVALLHPYAANYFMTEKNPVRTGNAHPNVSPYDQFRTRTKRIFLAIGNNRQFARFCAEIGRPELTEDARFHNNADRVVNRAQIRAELEDTLAAIDGEALVMKLLDQGVPCGVVLELPDVLTHAHTKHRNMIYEEGEFRAVGSPVKLTRTPPKLRRKPPAFGAANREVLGALGYDKPAIDDLVKRGIVGEVIRKPPRD